MQDPQKIARQIATLNAMTPKVPNWVEGVGYHALMAVKWSKSGADTSFLPSEGYPVKIFINSTTGEVKVYGAFLFEK